MFISWMNKAFTFSDTNYDQLEIMRGTFFIPDLDHTTPNDKRQLPPPADGCTLVMA